MAEYPSRFSRDGEAVPLRFEKSASMESGWEAREGAEICVQYGGLLARLGTVAGRLSYYLAGEIKRIPELEVERHPVFDVPERDLPRVRASRVKPPQLHQVTMGIDWDDLIWF